MITEAKATASPSKKTARHQMRKKVEPGQRVLLTGEENLRCVLPAVRGSGCSPKTRRTRWQSAEDRQRYLEPQRRLLVGNARFQEIAFVADRSGVFTSVSAGNLSSRPLHEAPDPAHHNQHHRIANHLRRHSRHTNYWPTMGLTPNPISPIAAAAAALPLSGAPAGWTVSTRPLV